MGRKIIIVLLQKNPSGQKSYCCNTGPDHPSEIILSSAGLAPANGPPFANELFMKTRGLHDADEHEHKASPSAKNLDCPALPLCRKDRVLSSVAVGFVPEDIATQGASARVTVAPRRIRLTPWRAAWWHAPALAGATAQLPRPDDKDPHGLDVHQNGGKEYNQCGPLHLPDTTQMRASRLASPPYKLHKIEHERQHNGDLQSMEEVHDSSS